MEILMELWKLYESLGQGGINPPLERKFLPMLGGYKSYEANLNSSYLNFMKILYACMHASI
jgi:hypothetical protein